MNKTRMIWTELALVFAGINVYAFVAGTWSGLVEFFQNLGPWGVLAVADLLFALTIGIVAMWQHARARDLNPVPWLVATLCTGSLGLLIYFARHAGTTPVRQESSPIAMAAAA